MTVAGSVAGIGEHELVKTVILALRREAKRWSTSLIKERRHPSWKELESGLRARFTNHKEAEADLALGNFLMTNKVKT